MKNTRFSIKWKIFFYLLAFMGFLLLIMWLFQVVYLDSFYKTIKTNELEAALDNIEELIGEEDTEQLVEAIAESYDICIVVTDLNGNVKYSEDKNYRCTIHKLNSAGIKNIIQHSVESDGVIRIENDMGLNIQDNHYNEEDKKFPNGGTGNVPQDAGTKDRFHNMMSVPENDEYDSMLLAKKVVAKDGQEYFVLLNSIITPVNATVYTLRIQLIYISVTMVVVSLIVASVISTRVSRPIININSKAKEMAKGDYQVVYEQEGYKEIAELSKTLNYTASELKKTEDLQKEIIANVSHDLRTPLTMITAYAEVMRDIPGENSPENVQVIIDEAKRLTNLVNDMLDISKLQAGVSVLDAYEYNLTQGIKNVIDRYSKLVEQDGYKVLFEYVEDDVMVYADEFKIYQVLYNLINNAINYTGEDKNVKIRQIVNGDIVRIEVIDSGEGIAKEELENVWERYYKVDKKHKRAVMGTGLGLSIVKNILKLHDAKFGVISRQGEGSTFWFELKII